MHTTICQSILVLVSVLVGIIVLVRDKEDLRWKERGERLGLDDLWSWLWNIRDSR